MQVLADWSITRSGLFLYYSNRRYPQAALGAFIDCLLDRDQSMSKRGPKAAA
jgi:DNA-binding transcriptional LysR family regulator